MAGLAEFHTIFDEANYASPEFVTYQLGVSDQTEAAIIETQKKLEVIELEKYGITRYSSFPLEESGLGFRRGVWVITNLEKFFPLLEEAVSSKNIDVYIRSLEELLRETAIKMSNIAFRNNGEFLMFESEDIEINFRIDAMTRLQEYAKEFNTLGHGLITKYIWDFADILKHYELK